MMKGDINGWFRPAVIGRFNSLPRLKVTKFKLRCLIIRQRCDRNMPCHWCSRGEGHVCERPEGLNPAPKPISYRGMNKGTLPPVLQESRIKREEVTYLSPSSSSDLDSDDDYTSKATVEVISPKSKIPKREKKGYEPKALFNTPKKRISNAVTFRGDKEVVWIERPHPQQNKPLCRGTPEVWCTVCIPVTLYHRFTMSI